MSGVFRSRKPQPKAQAPSTSMCDHAPFNSLSKDDLTQPHGNMLETMASITPLQTWNGGVSFGLEAGVCLSLFGLLRNVLIP
jgi:hypothetical protein